MWTTLLYNEEDNLDQFNTVGDVHEKKITFNSSKCASCDTSFTSRNLLNRHKRTHHAGDWPVCDVKDCEK